MKKIMRGVCLMGVLALLATSCNKNKETVTSIKTYNQQMEVVAGEFEDGQKVQLNPSDNRLYFEDGDLLTLFKIAENPVNSACADFYPTVGSQVDQTEWTPAGTTTLPDEGDLYAFCPGGTDYVRPDLVNENRATFVIPATQNYRENTCPKEGFFMASKSEDGETFYFKNICGLLWLKLYSASNRTVKSIKVTDRGGKHLAGDVSLKIDKVNPETLTSLYRNYNPNSDSYMSTLAAYIRESGYSVTNLSETMTLDCGNGVQIGTKSAQATNFYLTMRPLALREGFDIEVECTDGYIFNFGTAKSNIVGPNIVKKMPALDIR